MTNEQLQALRNASDDAMRHAEAAIDAVQSRALNTINGHGIISDPRSLRADLVAARKEIDAALEALSRVEWPAPADYPE